MKKYGKRMWLLCLCLLVGMMGWAIAEGEEDSEESLRWLLSDLTGQDTFDHFCYGDYDGDGVREAFALVGPNSNGEEPSGELWFVSPIDASRIWAEGDYNSLEMQGNDVQRLFVADVRYAGSGTQSLLWTVEASRPIMVDTEMYGGISYGGGNEFYAYISAFDGSMDGTGHTWKCYYYFLDGTVLREYGGIYISQEELLQFEGAEAILLNAIDSGYQINDIIYRGNGIINVNISLGTTLDNLTLRYDETSVWDTGEHYGGVYDLANDPDRAVYPEAFVPPVVSEAGEDVQVTTENGQWNQIPAYSFARLSKTMVADVNAAEKDGLLEVNVYFRDGVTYGGSEGFQKNWSTEKGILAIREVDLDGDGALEWMVFTTGLGSDEYEKDLLQIYESENGQFVKTAELRYGETLFPCCSQEDFRLVQTQDGLRIMHSSIVYGDGATCIARAQLYRYDGSALRMCYYADINNWTDSFYVAADLPCNAAQEIMSNYYGIEETIGYLESNYGLTRDQMVIISKPDETEQFYGGFDVAAEQLAPYNLDFTFEVHYENDWSYVDGCQFVGGEIFFSVEDIMEGDTFGLKMRMDTTLDHFDGNTPSAPLPANDLPAQEEVSWEAPVQQDAYTTGDVNMRTGPGLGYDTICAIPSGSSVVYLGASEIDERGVAWYKVNYQGQEGWCSEKYVVIQG